MTYNPNAGVGDMTKAVYDPNSDNAIATGQIENDAVDSTKLKDDAVTDANRSVTSDHVRDSAITTAKIANDAVDATKLKDDAITDANRAVTTDHIRDSAINASKIATDAVIAAKILAGAVTNAKLQDDSVTTVKIVDANVTSAKIATGARVALIGGSTDGATAAKCNPMGYSAPSATEGDRELIVPRAGNIRNFYIETNGSLTVTVRKNGVDTALAATTVGAGTANDTADVIGVVAGDTLSISLSSAEACRWGFEYET